ncbi:MAG: MgtC/SapB transporter [Flavobacteriales bacterium]|nr:MAG: MgtC/SapB transporter [Flavobacteriales bacterium]
METLIEQYQLPFLKLLIALGLGLFVGTERQLAGKTAGIKTHALVSMGSALFVIISSIITKEYVGDTMFDPLRVASHIIVGVGFIGGGAIFLRERSVSGLTTAANLWIAAGIGMAVGFGLYPIAIFATVLALLVFLMLRGIRILTIRMKRKKKKPS